MTLNLRLYLPLGHAARARLRNRLVVHTLCLVLTLAAVFSTSHQKTYCTLTKVICNLDPILRSQVTRKRCM
jgi:hypothetical protein